MVRVLRIVAPVIALAGLVLFFGIAHPLSVRTDLRSLPDAQEAEVESVRLEPGIISVTIRYPVEAPLKIAQVQIDGAFCKFKVDEAPTHRWQDATTLNIDYPWMRGERHNIIMIASTGFVLEHTIELSANAPPQAAAQLRPLILTGLILGLSPLLAMCFAGPIAAGWGDGFLRFLLAFAIGLLAYAFADTLRSGLEAGRYALEPGHAIALTAAVAGLTAGLLIWTDSQVGWSLYSIGIAAFLLVATALYGLGTRLETETVLAAGIAALSSFFLARRAADWLFARNEGTSQAQTNHYLIAACFAMAMLVILPGALTIWAGRQTVEAALLAACFGACAGAILNVTAVAASAQTCVEPIGRSPATAYLLGIGVGLASGIAATALL